MNEQQATKLAGYCRRECFWILAYVWPKTHASVVELRLQYPKGKTRTICNYSRAEANQAIEWLCAESDRWLASLVEKVA